MSPDRHRLARIIFSGINDIEEWKLGNPELAAAKGYPLEFPADLIDDFGIIFADLALDAATGELVCHEVNGPNAVGSDALTGDSSARAENEARQAVRRARELGHISAAGKLATPVVTIHAHQHWKFFRTGGEFYPRVDAFAEYLAAMLPEERVQCHAATDPLGDASVAVVMGDVPSIARNLNVDPATGRFDYKGRPVIFIGNPNLLPELIRIGRLTRREVNVEGADLRVLHAWRLADICHSKGLQQRLFDQTGIRPLRHFSAQSAEETTTKARELLAHGPVVLKPAGTSGGAGVCVVMPDMTDAQIEERIGVLLSECRTKYGDNAEAMTMPIGGFEFVRSTGYPMADGDHLWDLRIAVMFEPGKAWAYPVSLRFAPLPFDPASFHLDRDQWISNVSGRQATLLKSGMDDAVLEKVGMTDALMKQAMASCVRWTNKAWDLSIRDGGADGSVYEDSREEVDRPFYDWERFTA